MKWAIIGGGLAGLAAAYQLLERGAVEVHLYEAKEIGAGASGACTGLLHAFPGERANLSTGGRDALAETKRLLHIAADQIGKAVAQETLILRLAMKESQIPIFQKNSEQHEELTFISKCANYDARPALEIMGGSVVFMPLYLRGLFEACLKMGLIYHQKRVERVEDIDCDHLLICAGAGLFGFNFAQDLPIKQVKGQALLCEGHIDRAVIGKGHLSPTETRGIIQLGSTYEHDFKDEAPDLEVAKSTLYEKIGSFHPNPENYPIIDCRAGIRVSRKNDYLPIVQSVTNNTTVITAFGSRGLLYHASAARQAIENRLSYKPCMQVSSF